MYRILSGLIRLLSHFPLRLLYFFSDVLYFITYYIAGYRKKVVMQNLSIAFPEKTLQQRKRIAKDFYHNLIDTFIETLKFFSWDMEDVEKRLEVDDSGFVEACNTGQPVNLFAMHNFNWEFVNWWAGKHSPLPIVAIYMPVGNPHLDKMIYDMRTKQGTILIPATDFRRQYLAWLKKRHILGTVADQSPGNPSNAYWLPFFGRKTAFIKGAERGAAAVHASVVFLNFYKIKRGYYRIESKFIVRDAATLPRAELTKRYVQFVEDCIRRNPSNYLWSHRRWKHEWKPEYDVLNPVD
jgi:KDO2-lipid IV(A) lauroyltransferase